MSCVQSESVDNEHDPPEFDRERYFPRSARQRSGWYVFFSTIGVMIVVVAGLCGVAVLGLFVMAIINFNTHPSNK